MKFANALDLMQAGKRVKLPEWGGYWFWDVDVETIIIHNKDATELDIRDTKVVDFTLRNICREDWEMVDDNKHVTEEDTYWWDEVNFEPEEPHVLKRGDQGDEVKLLQESLNRVGFDLLVDGDYGPGTERAVRDFQDRVGIVGDGVFGDKTAAVLSGHPFPETLQQSDIEWAAQALDCEVAAVMAVSEVESRGQGFFTNGKPAILFERHWMRRRLNHYGIDYSTYLTDYPNIVNTRAGGYKGGVTEHDRLEQAIAIHKPSALESASWGAYQIMGFHWQALGYESPEDYVEKMHQSEGEHLKAFVRFIQNDSRLLKAIRAKDWERFAHAYNGPAYRKNAYHTKMDKAYKRLSNLLG